MGDVVLVVAYDLAVCEGRKKGAAELSLLSVQQASPQPHQQPSQQPHYPFVPFFPSAIPAAPPMMRSATSPPSIAVDPPSLAMPPPPLPASARSHLSPAKPHLSLHIPPPAQFVRRSSTGSATKVAPSPGARAGSTPHTPWGQVVHTPAAPPPVNAMSASPAHAQRERLEHIWRQNATSSDWDLHSPALMGVSAPPEAFPTLEPIGPPIPLKPASAAIASPHLGRAASPSAFDIGSAFDDAVAFSPLAAPPSPLPTMNTPAGSFPTPVYSTFPVSTHSPDLPGSPYMLDTHYHHQQQPQVSPFQPYDSRYSPAAPSPVPDLVPMSATSSSTGSVTSSSSARTVPNAQSAGNKAVDKQKMEQDYFSSLLGSSTKYTGVYS